MVAAQGRAVILRDFQPGDLAILHQIDAACFPPAVSYSLEELRAFISHRNSRTWVAEENGVVAGFLIAQKTPVRALHIITIDVRAGLRRRGVGARLMEAAEDWGRRQRLRVVSLETAEDNLPAQAFYQKRDYRKLGRVEGYYADGSAAWVMGKSLV